MELITEGFVEQPLTLPGSAKNVGITALLKTRRGRHKTVLECEKLYLTIQIKAKMHCFSPQNILF